MKKTRKIEERVVVSTEVGERIAPLRAQHLAVFTPAELLSSDEEVRDLLDELEKIITDLEFN